MEFIDFDTFTEENDLPQPQPPLSLPINLSTNIKNNLSTNNLSINFKKITQNLLNQTASLQSPSHNDSDENEIIDSVAAKYAKLSLSMIDSNNSTNGSNSALRVVYDDHSIGDASNQDLLNHDKLRSNVLSSRLSRILNNSASDNVIKESLTLLQSNFNESNSSNNLFLIETGILGSISRRKLRSDIENDLIDTQSSILDNYKPIYEKLIVIQSNLNDLNVSFESLSDKITNNNESNIVNDEVKSLINEKNLIAIKKNLLINFKKKFAINEYEEHFLKFGEINDEFLTILLKIESIYSNCSILLSMNNQNLGLKIMSQMSNLIDLSVQRINKFISLEFKNISNSINSNSSSTTTLYSIFFKKLMYYFYHKNENLSNLIGNFIEIRSNFLIDDFLAQINGNDSSSNRPIILSAHDPVRFIGDLLAYIHSVVVNEKDLVSNIFKFKDDKNNDLVFEDLDFMKRSDASYINESGSNYKFNDYNANLEIMNKILDKLTNQLYLRIEQNLVNENQMATIYSIYNLLDLYILIFRKFLNEESTLIKTIEKLITLSQDRIIDIISEKIGKISNIKSEELDLAYDLQPPEWIIEFYSDLLPLLDSSTSETFMNLDHSKSAQLENYIIIEPINCFEKQILKELPIKDKLIAKLNFYDLIMSKILPINLLSKNVLMINDKINELTTELTNYEINSIIESNKLINYLNLISMICPFSDDFFDVSIYQPITENKYFNPENLKEIDLLLQEFLPTCIIDIQQSLIKLNSPIAVNDVIINCSITFINFYHKFELLCIEYLGDQIFKWNDLEVATLLGVEEPYVEQKKLLRFD